MKEIVGTTFLDPVINCALNINVVWVSTTIKQFFQKVLRQNVFILNTWLKMNRRQAECVGRLHQSRLEQLEEEQVEQETQQTEDRCLQLDQRET